MKSSISCNPSYPRLTFYHMEQCSHISEFSLVVDITSFGNHPYASIDYHGIQKTEHKEVSHKVSVVSPTNTEKLESNLMIWAQNVKNVEVTYQFPTHGQWWSNFATHLSQTEQCLDLKRKAQNWYKFEFCKLICKSAWKLISTSVCSVDCQVMFSWLPSELESYLSKCPKWEIWWL